MNIGCTAARLITYLTQNVSMMQLLYAKVRNKQNLVQVKLLIFSTDPNVVNSLNSSCDNGALRLIKGDDNVDMFEGRVEVCVNNLWGSVCNRGFRAREADVICRQLHTSIESMYLLKTGIVNYCHYLPIKNQEPSL